MWYPILCAWLTSLNVMISSSIHSAAIKQISSCFTADSSLACVPHRIYPCSCCWAPHLSYREWSSINLGVQLPLLQHADFVSSGHTPRSGRAGLRGSSVSRFLRNRHTALHRATLIYILTTTYEGFSFSTSSPTFAVFCFSANTHLTSLFRLHVILPALAAFPGDPTTDYSASSLTHR